MLLLVAALGLSLIAGRGGQLPPSEAEPCAAFREALAPRLTANAGPPDIATVAFQNDETAKITDDPPALKTISQNVSVFREGWVGETPPVELVNLLATSSPSSAFRCRGYKAITGGRAPLSAVQATAQLRNTLGDVHSPLLVNFTLPVIDPTSGLGLSMMQRWGNSLGGSEEAILIAWRQGRWIEVGHRTFLVS